MDNLKDFMTEEEKVIDVLQTFILAGNIIEIGNDEFQDVKDAIKFILNINQKYRKEMLKCTRMENELGIKNEIINMMAEDLKTPEKDSEWLKWYYEHRAIMRIGRDE